MEITEEENFLAWKEDITQKFLGKGKALFQVNLWFTWLKNAVRNNQRKKLTKEAAKVSNCARHAIAVM
jgi:hypothetical protein